MKETSKAKYQQIAGRLENEYTASIDATAVNALISKIYPRSEMVIALVGVGISSIAAGLAALVKKIYLVGGSSEMLDIAKKNLSQFSNIEFQIAEEDTLPFASESLDAVFVNMYLHHTADPQASIKEMVRVLRPGGRLVIIDLNEHTLSWLKEELAAVWQGFKREQIHTWYQQVGLVNIVIADTGQDYRAEFGNFNNGKPDVNSENIRMFIASATRKRDVQAKVQTNYAKLAKSGSSCCNASSLSTDNVCCIPNPISIDSRKNQPHNEITILANYPQEDLSSVPQAAADFSLGCGNPLAMAGLKEGEIVVDIGSGGGLDAFMAAQKVSPGGRVIGVDMTPEMLERARANAKSAQIQNVEFRQGYAESMPVDSDSVDVILSNCVINLSEDKGKVFSEAFRVLKPGGRLEVSDIVSTSPLPNEVQENEADWAACISGALPETEYLDLVRQAGFVQIHALPSAKQSIGNNISIFSIHVSARKPAQSPLCDEN